MFNKQKTYFKKKAVGVQNMIWDLEFKRFKTLEIREEIRQNYDANRSKLEVLQTQIASQKDKPTMPADEIKRLDDQEVILKRDVERGLAQMADLDAEVQGANGTSENPAGVQGINQQLEALRELQVMLKDYIDGL